MIPVSRTDMDTERGHTDNRYLLDSKALRHYNQASYRKRGAEASRALALLLVPTISIQLKAWSRIRTQRMDVTVGN